MPLFRIIPRKRAKNPQSKAVSPEPTETVRSCSCRGVHFASELTTTHTLDHVRDNDEATAMWWDMDELKQARKESIKDLLRAQYYSAPGVKTRSKLAKHKPLPSIESENLTWRGMEDIRQGLLPSRKESTPCLGRGTRTAAIIQKGN
jgi:hypothetical protein